MNSTPASRGTGQALVILVLALVAMMAMTGLIIDGGNAYAQQRGTQNGADAASEAGAVVLAQNVKQLNAMGTALTDQDVLDAMNESAGFNGIKPFDMGVAGNSAGHYTDFKGNLLRPDGTTTTDTAQAAQVGSDSIPPCNTSTSCLDVGVASGIRATAFRDFKTFVSGIVGFTQFTATSVATAVAGYTAAPCDAEQGCALLPVTFSTNQNTCDGSGDATYDPPVEWLDSQPPEPPEPFTAANEVLLSLCKKGEGAFGWLDYGCGNIADQILEPCNSQIYFPTWLESQPGNPNNVEDELDTYAGDIVGVYEPGLDLEVLIPFFDGLCNEDRPGAETDLPDGVGELPVFGTPPFPGECASNPSGGGANRHYHVVYFIGFVLDKAYVQGTNFPDCNVAPGGPPTGPFPGGNGSGGCLKGWFARVVAGPGPVTGSGEAGEDSPLSIQLIK
jgi:hypothetical protein